MREQNRKHDAAAGLCTRVLAILVFAATLIAGVPSPSILRTAPAVSHADQARSADSKGLRSGAPELRQRAIQDVGAAPPAVADFTRCDDSHPVAVTASRPVRPTTAPRLAARAVTVAQPRAPPIRT